MLSMLKAVIGRKEVLREDEIGNGWQLWEGIRRVSKDENQTADDSQYESEDVAFDQYMFIGTYLLHALCDETSMVSVLLHYTSLQPRDSNSEKCSRTRKRDRVPLSSHPQSDNH